MLNVLTIFDIILYNMVGEMQATGRSLACPFLCGIIIIMSSKK